MAERRMSRVDQEKKLKDNLAELRERGIADAQSVTAVSQEGALEVTDKMLRRENKGFVRDQSQAQIEHGQETAKLRGQESQAEMDRLKKERGLD